jgi:hypothetical protein
MPGPPVLPPQPGITPGSYLNPGGTGSWKLLDICKMAMVKIGAIDPTEVPDGLEADDVQAQANMLIDSWNAENKYIFANYFFTGVMTPNLQPHLIGPSGTANFNGSVNAGQSTGTILQRPVRILRANILLNANSAAPFIGQTTTRINCRVHQDKGQWWANKNAPGVASVTPTDIYYEPDFPNGSMYIWVVPTVAYPLELLLQSLLVQYQLTDTVSLPPGGLMSFVYSLAEMIAPDFDLPWTPALENLKRAALRRFTNLNIATGTFGTRDAGLPGGKTTGKRSDYNYVTKQTND